MINNTACAQVYVPHAPHAESLADPRLTIRDDAGSLLVHYCPRHCCGGVYDLETGVWSLYSPMTAVELLAALPRLGVRIADEPALQAWLDAIATLQPVTITQRLSAFN